MKPAAFAYHAPRDVDSAIALLGSLENAKILAGGQSLVPMLNMRYAAPDHLIDINKVAGLAGIRVQGDVIEIGAMTRQVELIESRELAQRLPLIAAALHHIGHVQTRSRGTIGGSLCHLDPAAELPLVALVHDAILVTRGPRGERAIRAAEWALGFMAPALSSDEILVSVRFGTRGVQGFGFHEFARRHGDFAIVAAAALIELDGGRVAKARIGLGGAAATPLRLDRLEQALLGRSATQLCQNVSQSDAAIMSVLAGMEILSDSYYSAEYRRHLARILLRRALEDATVRAQARSL